MNRIKELFIKYVRPEHIVISLLLILKIVYYSSLNYHFTPDSYDYLARNGFSWLHGTVDRYRLPVYPMLLDICQFLSKNNYARLICNFQLIVSLLSVVLLYRALKKVTDKKWICLSLTFIYGMFSAVCGWDKTILTESFSLSLTVFILFGMISFIKNKAVKHVVFTTVCLLFGCFLRAIFVIYAGLFFGFLILITIFPGKSSESPRRSDRLTGLKGALIAVIPIILVFFYAFAFNNQFGGFTISDSALGQQLYVVVKNGYYKDSSDTELKETADSILNSSADSLLETKMNNFINDYYKNFTINSDDRQKIKDYILSFFDNEKKMDKNIEDSLNSYLDEEYKNGTNCGNSDQTYLVRLYIMETYNREKVSRFVNESKRNHLKTYLLNIPFNLCEKYSCLKLVNYTKPKKFINNSMDNIFQFLEFSVFHSLIISLLELYVFLRSLIKNKKVDWIRLGLCVFILSTVLLSIFGTNYEYARTAVTCLPFMFAALAMYAEWFCEKISRAKNKDE